MRLSILKFFIQLIPLRTIVYQIAKFMSREIFQICLFNFCELSKISKTSNNKVNSCGHTVYLRNFPTTKNYNILKATT